MLFEKQILNFYKGMMYARCDDVVVRPERLHQLFEGK